MTNSGIRQAPIVDLMKTQREFFDSGRTRSIDFRLRQLRALRAAIIDNEAAILEACRLDLSKPPMEAYTSERGMLLNEIDHVVGNVALWARPRRTKTRLLGTRLHGLAQHFLATSHIYPEPFGVVLIFGPWNYPFQLTLTPLVGAIAAGNCSVVKPSDVAPHSSAVIARLIRDNFDPGFISVVEGGAESAQALLAEQFDYIFFTGGTRVGQIVMEAAAKHLTPVTLELGGKNPCIVDRNVHVEHTARRIAWGKFFNAGQTCLAPDYVLVDSAIKKQLLSGLERTICEFFSDDPSRSPDYGRIIDKSHFERLSHLLKEGDIVMGGITDAEDRYISPTIIDNVTPAHEIMKEEVFGPILPVIEYEMLDEAISFVNRRPKPLALYFFSRDKASQERVLRETSAGGGCINDTFVHQMNSDLPFGGVGASGMGKYHGRFSYDTFSNLKGIMKKSFLFDLTLRYPPYEGKWAKWKRFL